MTRIVGDPECPLCHSTADRDDAFFPEFTEGLGVDPAHSLFHRPAFHWSCYFAWPERETFARSLFNRHVERLDQSTLRGRAYLDDDIAVYVAVYEPLVITIVIAQTGRSFCASQADWTRWQQTPDSIARNLHDDERRFLTLVLPRVWALMPTRESLVSQTDWTGTERHLYADT